MEVKNIIKKEIPVRDPIEPSIKILEKMQDIGREASMLISRLELQRDQLETDALLNNDNNAREKFDVLVSLISHLYPVSNLGYNDLEIERIKNQARKTKARIFKNNLIIKTGMSIIEKFGKKIHIGYMIRYNIESSIWTSYIFTDNVDLYRIFLLLDESYYNDLEVSDEDTKKYKKIFKDVNRNFPENDLDYDITFNGLFPFNKKEFNEEFNNILDYFEEESKEIYMIGFDYGHLNQITNIDNIIEICEYSELDENIIKDIKNNFNHNKIYYISQSPQYIDYNRVYVEILKIIEYITELGYGLIIYNTNIN